MRLTLLGVGAMNSPRYAPAGLLVEHRRQRVMLDGGPGAEPDGDDKTVVDVRLSYYPPAGAIGHAVASLFGADPKSDENGVRMRRCAASRAIALCLPPQSG